MAAGLPDGPVTWLVRGTCPGCERDPPGRQDRGVPRDQRHADDETAEWEAFVGAWREHRGETVVRAGDLDDLILATNLEMLSLALAGTNNERGRRVKLGQELRKRRDAVIAGCRIKVSDRVDRHGCWHYRLEVVGES